MSKGSKFTRIVKRTFHLWIVGLAAIFLAVAVVRLLTGKDSEKNSFERSLSGLTPSHPTVSAVSLVGYSNSLAKVNQPYRIRVDEASVASFFVPESRVWCASRDCMALIARSSEKCPVCGTVQPVEPADDINLDSDGGGLPDKWEIRYGLDPFDPADDTIDSDGDGFSNLIEYLAGTDPLDPKSHPDLLDFLKVDKIVATQLPIRFMGATQLPNGKHRCQVNVREPGKPQADTYFLVEGDQIGKTDFKLLRYIETEEKRISKVSNTLMTFKIKKIQIGRGDKVVTIGENENVSEADYRITMLQTLDNSTFEIAGEGVFKIGNDRFSVISVDNEAMSVVLQGDANEKEYTITQEAKFNIPTATK